MDLCCAVIMGRCFSKPFMKIKMELDKKGLTNQKERKKNKQTKQTHTSHTASTLRHTDGGSNFYQAWSLKINAWHGQLRQHPT